MGTKTIINIDVFKAVTRAIAESDDLHTMADHLIGLLVAALDIKACSIFVLNPETDELERLASCGLSIEYINKGPLFSIRSLGQAATGEPVIIRDVRGSDQLQYPEDAQKEGIGAIVNLPISFSGRLIGQLRLYDHDPWDISDEDLDSLLLLSEVIGLAMTYTRLLNAFVAIKETVDDTHAYCLNPDLP